MNAATISAVGVLIVGVIAGVASLLDRRNSARDKARQADVSAVQVGQSVILDGIKWSEAANRELRIDLLAAEKRIDELVASREKVVADLAEARAECRQSAREIKVLNGQLKNCQVAVVGLRAEVEALKGKP